MIDGIMMVQITTLITANIQSILGGFTYVFKYVFGLLKNRYFGHVVCISKIDSDNEIYTFINNHIFNEGVSSDMIPLYIETDEKVDEELNLFVDYSVDSFKFIQSASQYAVNKEIKTFKYNDIVYKFVKTTEDNRGYMNKDKKSFIIIQIIEYSWFKQNIKHIKNLEQFLEDKFKISRSINYVYKISIKYSNELMLAIRNRYGNNLGEDYYITELSDDSFDICIVHDNYVKNKNMFTVQIPAVNFYKNNGSLSQHDISYRSDVCTNADFGKSKNTNDWDIPNVRRYSRLGKYIIFTCNSYSITLEIISKKRKISKKEISDEINYFMTGKAVTSNDIKIYKYVNKQWKAYTLHERSFDTIYLPMSLLDNIRKEIEDFVENENKYKRHQIPYRKGMLLYGPPGTGKTSLVKAIANEYNMSIYILDINSTDINDETIVDILGSLGDNTDKKILLFEDIDSAFSDKEKLLSENRMMVTKEMREGPSENAKDQDKKNDGSGGKPKRKLFSDVKKENKFLTYSGLLNALDGVISDHSGLFTIMTTNYVEKLGGALIRPGRIDVKFELTYCTQEQIVQMVKSFCDVDVFNSACKEVSKMAVELEARKIRPCQLQFYLLKYENDIGSILDNYSILDFEETTRVKKYIKVEEVKQSNDLLLKYSGLFGGL